MWWLALTVVFLSSSLFADEVSISQQRVELFQPATEGYEIYRIPGMVTTPKGSVIVYCEARKNSRSDWGAIDILLRRSTDGGETFGPPTAIPAVVGPKPKNPVAVKKNLAVEGEITHNNPVMLVEPDGRLHLLFCLEYMRCFIIHSCDDGVTWSAPEEITGAFESYRPEYEWQVLATGPGHGVVMTSGRLVVPVWLSTGTGGHAHRPSAVSVIVSDDHGQSWMRGPLIVNTTEVTPNPSETIAAELSNGGLLLSIRNESVRHRRLISRSPNGYDQWSAPVFEPALFEPVCMAGLISVEQSDKHCLIHVGPDSSDAAPPAPTGEEVKGSGKSLPRRNLSIQISHDDGAHWSRRVSLERGPSGYCDLAYLPNGTVLCLFESALQRSDGKAQGGQLTLIRMKLQEVIDATRER